MSLGGVSLRPSTSGWAWHESWSETPYKRKIVLVERSSYSSRTALAFEKAETGQTSTVLTRLPCVKSEAFELLVEQG